MENRKTGKLRTNYEKSKETLKRKGNWRKCKEASSHAVFVEKEERQEEILRVNTPVAGTWAHRYFIHA